MTLTTLTASGATPALAALTAGRDALEAGRLDEAFAQFQWAHGLSHGIRPLHLAAHRGMIRCAWLSGRMDQCFGHIGLLAVAFISERPRFF